VRARRASPSSRAPPSRRPRSRRRFQIAEEKFAPHNRKADENEPRFEAGRVEMIPEVGEAVRAFAEAGFIAATYDAEQGGMQLPFTVFMACCAVFRRRQYRDRRVRHASRAGASDLVNAFGTAAQKAKYLGPMLTGRFSGTMVLTEPQAGSSLAGRDHASPRRAATAPGR
jgi:butyryl-CoA dehydrogenase